MSSVKIAVLDDYQNIHKPYFDPLVSSNVTIDAYPDTLPNFSHPKTTSAQKDELISRLKPYEVIVTMRERTGFPAAVLNSLPNLKLLLTTGLKNAAIDMAAAKEVGITVTGTPSIASTPDATTQLTWALILSLARGIVRDDAAVKAGKWQHTDETGLAMGLPGKFIGVLGLGRIGVAVARIAVLAFGMKVIAWSSSLTQATADEKATAAGLEVGTFEVVGSKEELFSRADVVSVHYVLSDRSRGIVGKEELGSMKPSAIIVNTSRGPLVDVDTLYEILENGNIRGAGLDVFEIEQVVLTPHTGYAEEANMKHWYKTMAEMVGQYIKGEEVGHKLN
jgi:lactate dehydrogenase-like 2-hydroxyacid dehydrogenase